MCGKTRQDKIRNRAIRERVGIAPIVEKMVENRLRRLFVTLILSNSMSNPSVFLEETWSLLIECILYDKMKELKLPSIHFNILSYYFIYYLNMYKLIISF